MSKILGSILIYMASFVIIYSPINNAIAGEVMPAGTQLEEDSYVFSIEEATRLLERVEELEAKEDALNKYVELDILRDQQIDLYRINLNYTQTQLGYYIDLSHTNQDLIDRYDRRNRYHWLENLGFLALGIGLSTASFVVADNITDQMER
jgi:hypothetical protein|tara:strand:- start:1580 stop:2029 length:450 start_codon:yes stop_codon:yes gene_type:complete